MMVSLCAIPILNGLIASCLPPPPLATGYVEGEYALVAPIETATIEQVSVSRGDKVEPGQELAVLERRDAEIAVAQARASLAKARSNLANISRGRRPEEIAALEAGLASAEAQAEEAKRELDRQKGLLDRGIVSQAVYDSALTQYNVALARVAEQRANLKVANLPAREDEIAAAKATVEEAETALESAEWRLSKRTILAMSTGTVFDVIRDVGEVAGPQAPVVSLLPEGAIKLRLYVPEQSLSRLEIGTALSVECDECEPGITAKISYISPDPEFTPPVIYSLENRQKLVYLVEARLDGPNPVLRPGQIVNVALGELAR